MKAKIVILQSNELIFQNGEINLNL